MMNEKAQYRRDPSALTGGHSPAALLRAFLRTTSEQILPLTTSGVRSGSKVFGAAVLKKKDLEAVTVATNQEGKGGPLRHGEVEAVEGFYALEEGERPEVKDTVFFATHEPCSLCLSAIAWGGWDNFFYLFTYEDTRDAFSIPHDLRILEEVFRVPSTSGTCDHASHREEPTSSSAASTAPPPSTSSAGPTPARPHPLYNSHNAFFSSHSCADLLALVPREDPDRAELVELWERVRGRYEGLAEGYAETKERGMGKGKIALA
ncbi:hypothetical protein JCM8202_002369 [Rhodotorula sphaerocarpa]